jgi:hypothetical protein
VAAAGAIAGRFRPAGCARAVLAAAAAQALVGAIAWAADLASPGEQGVYEVVLSTSLFVPMWLLSAWLFRRAARAQAAVLSAA